MSEQSDKLQADQRAMVKRHVDELCEHFESVQIFVSQHMPAELDGTVTVNQGAGSWLARYGQVREWITYHEERMRESGRQSVKDEQE